MPFFALDLEPRKIHHQTEEDQDCSNAFHLSFAARETQVKCLHDLTAEKDENLCLLFWSRNQHRQLANRISGHSRAPPLLLVVVWQPCTFGSPLINQRARALLCPQHSMWERRHTKDPLISSGRSWEWSGVEWRRPDHSDWSNSAHSRQFTSGEMVKMSYFIVDWNWKRDMIGLKSRDSVRGKCDRLGSSDPQTRRQTQDTSGTKPLMCKFNEQTGDGGERKISEWTWRVVIWCGVAATWGWRAPTITNEHPRLTIGQIIGMASTIESSRVCLAGASFQHSWTKDGHQEKCDPGVNTHH